jgi:hypothetical protein
VFTARYALRLYIRQNAFRLYRVKGDNEVYLHRTRTDINTEEKRSSDEIINALTVAGTVCKSSETTVHLNMNCSY